MPATNGNFDFDLKIVNGFIVDGTGTPGYEGDVGIRDGRIAAVGEAPGSAAETIDAAGKVVCPGFVDIHTHYDAQVMWDRMLTISPWHGVTTVVMGNCGFSVAPTRPEHRETIVRTLENVEGMTVAALREGLGEDWPFATFPEYLDAVEGRGTAINVGALVGHTALRTWVMGEDATEREATAAEVDSMRRIVREAMEAGALGFATSKAPTHVGYLGKPVPSRAAATEEIVALAGELRHAGRGGVVQATVGRSLSFPEFKALNEASGCPVSWTALLAGIALQDGDAGEQLRRSAELVAEGYDVVPQVSPRALKFEYQLKAPFVFESMRMFRPVSAAGAEGKKRLYADPGFRAAVWERLSERVPPSFRRAFRGTVVSEVPGRPELAERPLFELAEAAGRTPVEYLFDLGLESDLEARFRMPIANHDEDEVERLLRDPNTVVGLSDAGAHASQLCDACATTYLLRRWVREKKSIGLERAVRMITSRPAEVFGDRRAGAARGGARGGRRGVRPRHGRRRAAAARVRFSGRGGPPHLRGARHRGGDRERNGHPPGRGGPGGSGRAAARAPAPQRPGRRHRPGGGARRGLTGTETVRAPRPERRRSERRRGVERMAGYGYIIGQVEVKDPEAYREYIAQAPATIAQYGGEYLVRGGDFEVLEGEWARERTVVLRFPSVEDAKRWYASPEYEETEGAPQPRRPHQHGRHRGRHLNLRARGAWRRPSTW